MSRPQVLSLLLFGGWTVGLIAQLVVWSMTGYGDIFPPQMLLGFALCFGAGLREQALRASGTWSAGARAGATMMLVLIVSYLIVTAITVRPSPDSGVETWWTLLLEAPFWIGLPVGSAALLGIIGWRAGAR